MSQNDVFVICCVLLYGLFLFLCAWAWGFNVFVCFVCELLCAVLWCGLFVLFVCVCPVFACVACGVLCGGVWIACVVGWLCGWFASLFVWCVYGLCVCCRMDRVGLAVCVRAGLNVFVRFVCDLVCDVV